MQKRQYIFIGLMIILLYLGFKIVQFEYKKYIVSGYIQEQKHIIKELSDFLSESKETLKYINTKAFKNKVLKSELGLKMKGEDVIILTSEKIYKKFSGKTIVKTTNIEQKKKENNITFGMTNFQKWIYLIFKKDIR